MLKTLWMNEIKVIKMLTNHSKAGKREQKKKKRKNKQNIKCQF